MPTKQRTIHVSDEAWEQMADEAKADRRSISAYLDQMFIERRETAEDRGNRATRPATPRYTPARPLAARTPVQAQEGASQRDDDGIERVPVEDGP